MLATSSALHSLALTIPALHEEILRDDCELLVKDAFGCSG